MTASTSGREVSAQMQVCIACASPRNSKQLHACMLHCNVHCCIDALESPQHDVGDAVDLLGNTNLSLSAALATHVYTHVVDSLLCTCTVKAVSGIRGLAEAKGRGCLRSRELLCRGGYLVYSAGYVICTGIFAQSEYLLHGRINIYS